MSSPEATGLVVLFAGEGSPLLGLVSIVAPAICSGNAVVACSPIAHAPIVLDFAEVLATSDLPAGVVNLLTGNRDELLPTAATHRDIDAIGAVGLSMEEQVLLEGGASATIKRVWLDTDRTSAAWALADHQSLYRITPFLEVKTSWHPMGL
jgi:acyl-CoA reductase-like NAD-dependent aldehyde dehydrogenase